MGAGCSPSNAGDEHLSAPSQHSRIHCEERCGFAQSIKAPNHELHRNRLRLTPGSKPFGAPSAALKSHDASTPDTPLAALSAVGTPAVELIRHLQHDW
jgi:hypothetical protein